MEQHIKSFIVSPEDEQSIMGRAQAFGWELYETQQLHIGNRKKLLFKRDSNIKNYTALVELEKLYDNSFTPPSRIKGTKRFFKIGGIVTGISLLLAIIFYVAESYSLFGFAIGCIFNGLSAILGGIIYAIITGAVYKKACRRKTQESMATRQQILERAKQLQEMA